MAIIRATAAATVLAGAALGTAGLASAQEQLNGAYTFTNGPTTTTWSITTRCNQEGTCGGTISTSTGLLEQVSREAGGPWIIERHDVPNGIACADGGTGPADLTYSFDPATLVGTITYVSKPGACHIPDPVHHQQPISLVRR